MTGNAPHQFTDMSNALALIDSDEPAAPSPLSAAANAQTKGQTQAPTKTGKESKALVVSREAEDGPRLVEFFMTMYFPLLPAGLEFIHETIAAQNLAVVEILYEPSVPWFHCTTFSSAAEATKACIADAMMQFSDEDVSPCLDIDPVTADLKIVAREPRIQSWGEYLAQTFTAKAAPSGEDDQETESTLARTEGKTKTSAEPRTEKGMADDSREPHELKSLEKYRFPSVLSRYPYHLRWDRLMTTDSGVTFPNLFDMKGALDTVFLRALGHNNKTMTITYNLGGTVVYLASDALDKIQQARTRLDRLFENKDRQRRFFPFHLILFTTKKDVRIDLCYVDDAGTSGNVVMDTSGDAGEAYRRMKSSGCYVVLREVIAAAAGKMANNSSSLGNRQKQGPPIWTLTSSHFPSIGKPPPPPDGGKTPKNHFIWLHALTPHFQEIVRHNEFISIPTEKTCFYDTTEPLEVPNAGTNEQPATGRNDQILPQKPGKKKYQTLPSNLTPTKPRSVSGNPWNLGDPKNPSQPLSSIRNEQRTLKDSVGLPVDQEMVQKWQARPQDNPHTKRGWLLRGGTAETTAPSEVENAANQVVEQKPTNTLEELKNTWLPGKAAASTGPTLLTGSLEHVMTDRRPLLQGALASYLGAPPLDATREASVLGLQNFIDAAETCLAQLVDLGRGETGALAFHLRVGRIILSDIDPRIVTDPKTDPFTDHGKSFEPRLFLRELNSPIFRPEAVLFAPVVDTYSDYVNSIPKLKWRRGHAWAVASVRVFFELWCNTKGANHIMPSFVLDIDAETKETTGRFTPHESLVEQGYLHCPRHVWDLRAELTSSPSSLFAMRYGAAFTKLADSMDVLSMEPTLEDAIVHMLDGTDNIFVDRMRIRSEVVFCDTLRRSGQKKNVPAPSVGSSPPGHEDQASGVTMKLTQYREMEAVSENRRMAQVTVPSARSATGTKTSIRQERFLRFEPSTRGCRGAYPDVTYEVSFSHARIREAFARENAQMALGDMASWTGREFAERGYLREMLQTGIAMVPHLDRLGSHVDNGMAPSQRAPGTSVSAAEDYDDDFW